MGKQKYGHLANLVGFTNIDKKKREVAKVRHSNELLKTKMDRGKKMWTSSLIPFFFDYSSFANRSLRFMDAYRKGLNGNQAAWASKKYRSHRTIPESILSKLEKAGVY